MELFPGVHQIPVNYKGRPLNLYLLRSGTQSLLMDTGDASIPAKDILPYFKQINFDPRSLTYVMLTHPDLDHTGGIYAIQEAAPQAKFLCGTLDQEQIETPEALADLRANPYLHWHNIGMDSDKRAAFINNAGGPNRRISFHQTFNGGETLTLGNRTLHILHLPGHSLGHLGVYLPEENTAIIADAVHGTANRFLDGRAAFACTYMWIDAYLGTIDRLQAMNLSRLYSCHWPNAESPAAINAFLNDSRAYCLHAESVVEKAVAATGAQGITLHDLCLATKSSLGDWPAEKDLATAQMLCGHLQRLVNRGLVNHSIDRPTRYLPQPLRLGLR